MFSARMSKGHFLNAEDLPDDLVTRARDGDEAAANAIAGPIGVLTERLARKIAADLPAAARDLDAIRGDVQLGIAKALRGFDPSKGGAVNFMVSTAYKFARREARGYFSTIGAHIPGGKRDLDFDQPVFRKYAPFGPALHSHGPTLSGSCGDELLEEELGGALESEREERTRRYEANRRLGYLIWRLPPLEAEVVRRRFGIPRRARNLPPTRRAAVRSSARPESYTEIGQSLGVSDETVRQIVKRALPKIGLTEMPDPVARKRPPIET